MTSPDMTGYNFDSMASAWPKHVKFTLPGTYSHSFPWVSMLSCVQHLFLACYFYKLLILENGWRTVIPFLLFTTLFNYTLKGFQFQFWIYMIVVNTHGQVKQTCFNKCISLTAVFKSKESLYILCNSREGYKYCCNTSQHPKIDKQHKIKNILNNYFR